MTKALQIKDLRKTYSGGFEALKGITLDVEAGDFFAVLGPNGAGKSTTLGIITSLVTKTSGSIKMIARAMVHEPKMLILDEPTAGVDIEIRRSMWQFLRELNESGTTIILTTHYLEEAENLCRNVAIINNGEIIENTSMKKLLSALNQETFVLDLNAPLSKLPEIEGIKLTQINDEKLELTVERQQELNSIFTTLAKHGVMVSSMRNKSNRLEEFFLQRIDQDSATANK